MKTETSLRLSGAKSALAATKPDNTDDPTDSDSPIVDDGTEDPDAAAAAGGSSDNAIGGTGDSAAGDDRDRSKLHATITKSWTSGGIAGTDKDRVTITATYPAVQDKKTGAVSLGAKSFALTITNLDTKASSTIQKYLFSNTDWTEIPAPEKPELAEKFHVKGNVKIDVQTSGKMMRVRFHLDTGIHLSDIGYIFVLDIPENTKFIDDEQSEPSS
ncbi:hypothetical protein [Rhizobium sp. RCAM05973]|uniref:hypothetical protein n=1 Tax=Rhizobium sp. RCAM05973 TaxID=2994066 RepID=UPI0022EC0537|nr:hypothetical protein [Rhizobium sp. RCAM05973]